MCKMYWQYSDDGFKYKVQAVANKYGYTAQSLGRTLIGTLCTAYKSYIVCDKCKQLADPIEHRTSYLSRFVGYQREYNDPFLCDLCLANQEQAIQKDCREDKPVEPTVCVELPSSRTAMLKAMSYKKYLQTPEWQHMAGTTKKRANYRCQLCNNGDQILHAHHRTYERRGEELPKDLIALCADCHELFHTSMTLVKE